MIRPRMRSSSSVWSRVHWLLVWPADSLHRTGRCGSDAVRRLTGGVLLGWGAMIGLGCTVGTLLFGTMAGALSEWVYGISLYVAVWAGLKIKYALGV